MYKAKHTETGECFAVKKINASKVDTNPLIDRLLKTEISIMKTIEHPHVLHLYEFLKTKDHYYLVIKYCNQGDLEHYMKVKNISYFEEIEAVNILK